MKKSIIFLFIFAQLIFLNASAHATNGMNMISYGGHEAGMAGASLGISDNPMSMNSNPAGLTQIKNGELGFGISLMMPNLIHKDSYSPLGPNDKEGESQIFPLPMVAYAHRVGNGPFVVGLGFFAQGGMGADFKDLNTAFGGKDRTYTNVRYMKLTPAVAYQVNDKFSAGLALNIGYSDMAMKFFPETSVAPNAQMPSGFAGMDMSGVSTFGYGAKLGLMYKLNEMINFGAEYTSKAKLNYDNGDITLNMTGFGLGKVKYDASVDGFTWPQQAGVGVGVRPNDRLLLAADLTWVNWKDAIDVITIKASNPNNSSAPSSPTIPSFDMKWKDQIVVALGAAYKTTEDITVRAGYNYGKNPVPAENLSPLFPAITEQHITLGIGYKINKQWDVDGAWEHAFNKSVTYTNTAAPFGTNAVEEHDQNTIHLFANYKF